MNTYFGKLILGIALLGSPAYVSGASNLVNRTKENLVLSFQTEAEFYESAAESYISAADLRIKKAVEHNTFADNLILFLETENIITNSEEYASIARLKVAAAGLERKAEQDCRNAQELLTKAYRAHISAGTEKVSILELRASVNPDNLSVKATSDYSLALEYFKRAKLDLEVANLLEMFAIRDANLGAEIMQNRR